MAPSRSITTRSAMAAAPASCVTMITVWPNSSTARRSSPSTSRGGLGVEVAGRLVGEHHGGARDQRAGDGDALLLAARQLRRPVREAVAEADGVDERAEPLLVDLVPASISGSVMFSRALRTGTRLKAWKTKPSLSRRSDGERLVVEVGELLPVDDHGAGAGPVEPGEQVHQRGLARARRPHDRRELAGGEADRDAPQRVYCSLALSVACGGARRSRRSWRQRSAQSCRQHRAGEPNLERGRTGQRRVRLAAPAAQPGLRGRPAPRAPGGGPPPWA